MTQTLIKMDPRVSNDNECVDVAEYLAVNFNDQTARVYVQIPISVIYACIFLAGLSGNAMVIASVCRHRSLQTVRNLFIVSLSCSDIVVCLTSLPITPITFISKNWIFGSFLCYAFPLVQGMSVCISTFTLTAVAFDRYILIVFPTSKPIQRTQAIIIIGIIWALGAAVSIPMVLHYRHFYGPDRRMDVQPNGDQRSDHLSVADHFSIADQSLGDQSLDHFSVTDQNLHHFSVTDQNLHRFSVTDQSLHHFSVTDQSLHHSSVTDQNLAYVSVNGTTVTDTGTQKFCGYFCEEIWPSERVRQIYGSVVMIVQFLVPLTIISLCYSHICVRLAKRGDGLKAKTDVDKRLERLDETPEHNPRFSLSHAPTPGTSIGLNVCVTATAVTSPSVVENRRRAVLRRKRRTNRMLIAMVIIFGVCWAPQVLMNILRDLGSLPRFVNDQMYFYSLICHIIAMSSTIWNPILYAWMNETFRRSFLELLPCIRKVRRRLNLKKRGKIKVNSDYAGMNTIQEVDSRWDGAGATEQYINLLISDKPIINENFKCTSTTSSAINSPLLPRASPLEKRHFLDVGKPSFVVLKNGSTTSLMTNVTK